MRTYDSSTCNFVKIGTVRAISSASINSIARTKKIKRKTTQKLLGGRLSNN